MLRAPQIWSCPIRSFLLGKQFHLSSLSEETVAVRQSAGHGRGWKCKDSMPGNGRVEEVLFSTEIVPWSSKRSLHTMGYGDHRTMVYFPNFQSKAVLSRHDQPSLIFASAKAKQGQNTKALSIYCDCLTHFTCLQPWRRPWDFIQRSQSCTSTTLYDFLKKHLHFRQYPIRRFGSATHMTRTLKQFQSRRQASSFSTELIRRLHQAAPCVIDAWRDCLSLENENRCRQSLVPNLKFYEGTKLATGSQGENKEVFASVLVSLCSVGGEPAFLFTLRSSTLKGKHKGDVSFAGGKSDPSDKDVVATALREAREELGIIVASERVWGVLKPLRDGSGKVIAPVLANIGAIEDLTLKPNPGEVDEIFTLSLSHLCDPKNRGYTNFRIGDKNFYTVPVFLNGKHKVWGLTAVALDQSMKLIVQP